MSNNAPLKVLCLHGYRQSGQGFRTKTGGMRKHLKKRCEYVFVDAPHQIPETEDLGWWFSTKTESYSATEVTAEDGGFEQTLDFLANVFKEQGPFDGILSFSQGACLGGILSILKERGDERFINFNFAIIAAGYRSRTIQHAGFYDETTKVTFPTLHIIGDDDKVICREMSDDLVKYFDSDSAVVARHEGGHIIPTKGPVKSAITDFINERMAARV